MKLTIKQKSEICIIIDKWYFKYKDNLVDYKNQTHKLGFAKEKLKINICGEEK